MKIVTKKQMNLHELIKYVWECGRHRYYKEYKSACGNVRARLSDEKIDYIWGEKPYSDCGINTTFTVKVEEELTEDTVFDGLWDVYYDEGNGKVRTVFQTSPGICIRRLAKNSDEGIKPLAIFYGTTLIWSKDTGIPTEGTIEI